MKNDSNADSCISTKVPHLIGEKTTEIKTKRFSIINEKRWQQIWGGMRKNELDIQHYKKKKQQRKLETVSGLNSDEVPLVSCTSVDDVVPTMVDWQGEEDVYMPVGTSSNIVKIPSTSSDVNKFLAYTDHKGHCKMVLFQIARHPDTGDCSYMQLAAKYQLNTPCNDSTVYCGFLGGTCMKLVGTPDDQNGYGIKELTYEFPTSLTNQRAPICSVPKDSVDEDLSCTKDLDMIFPYTCTSNDECNDANKHCVNGVCLDGQLGTDCKDTDDCKSGFCVNDKCSDGQLGSVCVDGSDCISEHCGEESKLCEPRIATDLGFDEVPLVSCTSVDDVVPTMVDWQGEEDVYMPVGTSSNIVKIPSTSSDVNKFLAYTDHKGHCKMVLFQIARHPDTGDCSYMQLAAKYKSGACDENLVYCTFVEGTCMDLVGTEENHNGYGIKELTYEFPTSLTNKRAPICTVVEDDVAENTCFSSLADADPVFIPHACDEGSDCEFGFCVDGTCTDGQLGTKCNVGTDDCKSGFCVNSKCSVTDGLTDTSCSLHFHCLSHLCGSDGKCKSCTSGSDCNVSGLSYCVDGVCTDGEVGTLCNSGTDHCESGFCVGNICTNGEDNADCASKGDCKSGFCVNNKCSSGLNGATCSSDSHCQSNYCNLTKCATCPPPDPCKNNPCGPNQDCTKTSDTSYSCKCETTFILEGEDTPRPKCVCKAGVTTLGGYNRCECIKEGMKWSDQEADCKCPSEMEWSDEDLKCVEVNLCASKECGDNEACDSSTGKCSCIEGYQPGPDGNCVIVAGGDPDCQDNASFTFVHVLKNGENRATKCGWIDRNAKRVDRRRCYDKKPACDEPSDIGSKCKHACGFCDDSNVSTCATFAAKCADDPDFEFPMKRDPNEKRGCSWITWNDKKVDRRRSNYCSQKYILRKCPIACNRKLCV